MPYQIAKCNNTVVSEKKNAFFCDLKVNLLMKTSFKVRAMGEREGGREKKSLRTKQIRKPPFGLFFSTSAVLKCS